VMRQVAPKGNKKSGETRKKPRKRVGGILRWRRALGLRSWRGSGNSLQEESSGNRTKGKITTKGGRRAFAWGGR